MFDSSLFTSWTPAHIPGTSRGPDPSRLTQVQLGSGPGSDFAAAKRCGPWPWQEQRLEKWAIFPTANHCWLENQEVFKWVSRKWSAKETSWGLLCNKKNHIWRCWSRFSSQVWLPEPWESVRWVRKVLPSIFSVPSNLRGIQTQLRNQRNDVVEIQKANFKISMRGTSSTRWRFLTLTWIRT